MMTDRDLFCSSVSYWVRDAYASAIKRDPLDAARDAEALARLLRARCDRILSQDDSAMERYDARA